MNGTCTYQKTFNALCNHVLWWTMSNGIWTGWSSFKRFLRLEGIVRFLTGLKYSTYQFWHVFLSSFSQVCHVPLLGLSSVLLAVSFFSLGSYSNLSVTVGIVIQYSQLCHSQICFIPGNQETKSDAEVYM